MTTTSIDNRKRIIEISKKHKLTHVGSCLSVLPILEEIYAKKKEGDKVMLCGAHAHLAHLMFTDPKRAEEKIQWDIHCNRKAGCDASGGSLGHGGIALGMALANPEITVYLIETDGALGEGSCWETMRLKKLLLVDNLKIYVNANGATALSNIDRDELSDRLRAFCPDIVIYHTDNYLSELQGLQGHYATL